jgi:hypothetical protein
MGRRLAAACLAPLVAAPLQQGIGTRLAWAGAACAVLWAAVGWALS